MRNIFLTKRIISDTILIAFVILLIKSCTVDQNYNLANRIPDDTLRGILLNNYINSRRACLVFAGEHGLVTVVNNEEEVIQLRSRKNAEIIISDVSIGKGKNELLNYAVAKFDSEKNELHLISPVSKSYKRYTVTPYAIELNEEKKFTKDFPYFSTGVLFLNNFLVLNTMFDGNNLAVHDLNGKLISQMPNRLIPDEINFNQRYHQSHIAVSDRKARIITGDMDFTHLAMYSFNNEVLVKEWDKHVIEPDYYMNNKLFYFENTHVKGFNWLELGEDKIYALHDLQLHHDKSIPYHTFLFVFDLNGNLLYKYLLDHKIWSISFDSDRKTFYGVTEHPDVHIVKYQLP